jgi:hypothetical protein
VSRRKDEDIRKLEEAGQLRLVPKAGEADAVQTKFLGAGFERCTLLAIANDDEVRPVLRSSIRYKAAISPQEMIGVLARLEL